MKILKYMLPKFIKNKKEILDYEPVYSLGHCGPRVKFGKYLCPEKDCGIDACISCLFFHFHHNKLCKIQEDLEREIDFTKEINDYIAKQQAYYKELDKDVSYKGIEIVELVVKTFVDNAFINDYREEITRNHKLQLADDLCDRLNFKIDEHKETVVTEIITKTKVGVM